MPRRDLTFRVFVSSTFSDLVAERNALQEQVFPRLRDYCRKRGARFQAVDLRWGVSQEAALDQQTMNICLQELRRCQQLSPRPNFIVLLGDRYGWQPLPPQIDAGEFESLLNSLPDEVDRGRLLRWYRRDDNALPAEYCLLLRIEPFSDGEGWSVEEAVLLTILSRAVEQAIPAGDPRRRKYEESATHQEIRTGVLDAVEAANHVFCYFRQIEDLPQGHEAHCFRDPTGAGASDGQAAIRLRDLKTELETRLPPGHVYKYEAQWSGQAPQSDLAALCEHVERNLRNVIDAELEAYEEVPDLQREIDAHREFAAERRRHFIGRQAVLGTIRDYLDDDRRGPLVIHGCSGSGKTALLAQAWAEHDDQAGEAAIVGRFLGATPAASDLYSVLTSLCRQISQTYGDDTPIAGDVYELARSLLERFAVATPQRPLVLFLDAVEQLSPTDGAHTLSWLPRELPAHVKLVVSVLQVEGLAGKSYESARRLLPADALVELGGLPPGEGEQLLDAWLADAHRTLQPEQKQDILARFAGCPLPLYLKLAFEEARRWKSDDGLPAGSDDVPGLSGDIPGILHDLFSRLERPEHHGAVLVQIALGSLAAGRAGLVEDELLDVLSADEEGVMADFRRRSPHSPDVDHLPAVVWSRLYADLEPYLTTRRSDEARVLSFYHRQLIEAVESRYLQGENRLHAHGRLARYFAGRTRFADQPHEFTDPAGGRQPNRRKVFELPYQQTRGELWDDLSETLTDLPFLEVKNVAALVFDLANDFSQAVDALPGEHRQRRILTLLDEALRRDIHFIDRHREEYPQGLFQCLWNHGWWYDCDETADHYEAPEGGWPISGLPWQAPCEKRLSAVLERWRKAKEVASPGFAWVRSVRPPDVPLGSALRAVLRGHPDSVRSVAYSPDGTRLASGGDRTVRVWDAQSGRELLRLGGQSRSVECVTFSPEGLLIASAGSRSNRGAVLIWDARDGRERSTFCTPWQTAVCVAFSPDGSKVASAGAYDGTVQIWAGLSGHELRSLRGHYRRVTCVAFSPDGSLIASGADDETMRVWDTLDGTARFSLETYAGPVKGVAFSPDGSRIAYTAAHRGWVRVCDARDGSDSLTLFGHPRQATGVAFSPDGSRIASGSGDGAVRVWDADRGYELACLSGHTGSVTGVAFSPDGSRLASCSTDGTVRIWDALSAGPMLAPRGHTRQVLCLAFNPDGSRLASGSADGTVRIWGADRGRELLSLPHSGEPEVSELGFSRDGSQVAGGSAITFDSSERTVQVWDASSGEDLRLEQRDWPHSEFTAEYFPTAPFRLRTTPLGCEITIASSDRVVGWFPTRVAGVLSHPDGRRWAGRIGIHVVLITLEGDAPT